MPYSSAASKETTLLITHHEPQKPATKFPLGLVSEPTKSYLELIRIDKVYSLRDAYSDIHLTHRAADGHNLDVLAVRYAMKAFHDVLRD